MGKVPEQVQKVIDKVDPDTLYTVEETLALLMEAFPNMGIIEAVRHLADAIEGGRLPLTRVH